MYMKSKIIIIIVSIFLFVGCWFLWNKRAQTKEAFTIQEDNPYKDADIKAVVISSENNTFGYDIYMYDAVFVHQPSRPCLSGSIGFATEEDARKVAEFVIKKIHNNEMPPTVTMQELKELGVCNLK